MKKLTSLLLALVMVVSMLPGTAVPVAAAGTDPTIEANYLAAVPTTDGKLDEALWLLRDKIGSTPITVVCNEDKFFVGMKTNESKLSFTINEVAVEVDLDGKVVLVDGEKVGTCAKDDTAGTAEAEIPLSAVGMVYAVKQDVPFAATIGSDSYNGQLAVAYKEIKVADNFANLAGAAYAKDIGLNKTTQEVYSEQVEGGGIHFKTGTLTEAGNMLNAPKWNAGVINNNIGWEMSFTADFNDLPVANQLGYLALCGIAIDIRAEEYIRIGFFADDKGNVRVSLYDEPADLTKNFDTGVDLGAKNVDVKIVVTDDFTSQVFVNGKSVANFPNPTRTTAPSGIYFSATTLRRDASKDNKTDVVIYDFLLTQAAPNAKLNVSRAEGIKQDGSLSEPFWTMESVKKGTQFATLCDGQNLYIGLDSTESVVNFEINGTKAKATLGKAPKFELGFTMGPSIKANGSGQYEIAIPLGLFGIAEPAGQKVPFSIMVGNTTRTYDMYVGVGAVLTVA